MRLLIVVTIVCAAAASWAASSCPSWKKATCGFAALSRSTCRWSAWPQKADQARAIMGKYPEVESVVAEIGRPDDGTDPTGFYNVEFFVPLKPHKDWPKVKGDGWRCAGFGGPMRPRTKEELIEEMNDELNRDLVGRRLELLAEHPRQRDGSRCPASRATTRSRSSAPTWTSWRSWPTGRRTSSSRSTASRTSASSASRGRPNLEFRSICEKCKRWGVSVADVEERHSDGRGRPSRSRTMIEGEKMFDITLRWPEGLRSSETSILDIPVDVVNNQVVAAAELGTWRRRRRRAAPAWPPPALRRQP